jgi:hypothetical protein
MKLDGEHNKTHEVRIQKVAQVHWSQQRAWHGDEVTLSVRTEMVKDGAGATLKIQAPDADKDLDTVSGQSINNGKLDHKYKIEWKEKPYEAKRDFVCVAQIDKKLLSPPSPPLRVDLEPPLLSA